MQLNIQRLFCLVTTVLSASFGCQSDEPDVGERDPVDWCIEVEPDISNLSPPFVGELTACFLLSDGNLWCVNKGTGDLTTFSHGLGLRPLVLAHTRIGSIFLVTGVARIAAVDLTNGGEIIWSRELSGGQATGKINSSFGEDFFVLNGNRLSKIDTAGTLVAEIIFENQLESVQTDGEVVLVHESKEQSGTNSVIRCTPELESPVELMMFESNIISSVIQNGHAVVATSASATCIDLSGSLAWVNNEVVSEVQLVVRDERVYGAGGGDMWAIDLTTGSTLWRTSAFGVKQLLVNDEQVTGVARSIYVCATDNGSLLKYTDLGNDVIGRVSIDGEFAYYLGLRGICRQSIAQ